MHNNQRADPVRIQFSSKRCSVRCNALLGFLDTVTLLKIMIVAILLADVQDFTLGKVVSLPHTRYVHEGEKAILRCQNRSADEKVFYNYISNALWYHQLPNEASYQFGPSGPVKVQSHSLVFHPSVRKEDEEGTYYCCKPGGPCSGRSTVFITVPPIIKAVKQEYVSTRRSNVTLVCNISNPGRPVANFGWRRRGLWLPNKLISVNSTHFSLTLSNVTENDAGSYSCAAKGVLSFRIQKISLQIKVPPKVVIHAPPEARRGSKVSINCTVLKGYPPPSVSITTPQGEVIKKSVLSFTATMEDAGDYTCVANNSVATVMITHPLTIYIAPQPLKSRQQQVTATPGSDVVLPCVIEMAYPPPLYHWIHIAPDKVVGSNRFQQLSNGSLLIIGVKIPAIYKCIAWNEYGATTQIIHLIVNNDEGSARNEKMIFHITDPKNNCHNNRSKNFKKQVSAAFETYIQNICNCTATITKDSLICINVSTALYTIQLMESLNPTVILQLLNTTITMNNSTNLGVVMLHVWRQEYVTKDVDNDSDKGLYDWHTLIYLVFAILLVTQVLSIAYCSYKRCKRNGSKELHSCEAFTSLPRKGDDRKSQK